VRQRRRRCNYHHQNTLQNQHRHDATCQKR
jgi:hypothetical protein